MVPFPEGHFPILEELGAEVLERRGPTGSPKALARDLLTGFYERCLRLGLDGVLVDLGRAFTPLDISSETALSEEPRLRDALAARLSDRQQFDPGGPRAQMPRQLADCLAATLSLTPRQSPDRTITLSDAVRREVVEALSGPVAEALATPGLRNAIIATARELCEPQHHQVFDHIAPRLDKRGARFPPQPSLPIHAVQAVKRALSGAREEVIERAAHDAIDRTTDVLARANPDAAARIDQPISHRLTPRDVAILRLHALRIPEPDAVVETLLATLAELAELTWEPPEQSARPYNIRTVFAVGDLLDHPRFGRGTVHAAGETSIEVEFEDGTWRTLAHSQPR